MQPGQGGPDCWHSAGTSMSGLIMLAPCIQNQINMLAIMVHLLPTSATVQEERGVVAFTSSLDGIRSPFHGGYHYRRTGDRHFDQLDIDFRWCGPRMPTVPHNLRATFCCPGFTYRDHRLNVVAEVVTVEMARPFLENSDDAVHRMRCDYWDSLERDDY